MYESLTSARNLFSHQFGSGSYPFYLIFQVNTNLQPGNKYLTVQLARSKNVDYVPRG